MSPVLSCIGSTPGAWHPTCRRDAASRPCAAPLASAQRRAAGAGMRPCGCAHRIGGAARVHASPAVTLMVEQERALLSQVPEEDVVKALHLLGEGTQPGASRAELLHQLAARRIAERSRVVALPLRYTLSGPRRGGRRCITVPVDVEGLGFVDFLLEASSYSALVTPALRDALGFGALDGATVRALHRGGATLRQRIRLPAMWIGTLKLPPLEGYVTTLHAAKHRPDVGGVLGIKVLRRMEVDIDAPRNRVALHPAGHVAAGLLDTAGLAPVPCRFTKRGVVCVPVSLNGSPPFVGVLDLSAALSVINWEAAALLGMRREGDGDGGGGGAVSDAAAVPGCSDGAVGGAVEQGGGFGCVHVTAGQALRRPQPPEASGGEGGAPGGAWAAPGAAPAPVAAADAGGRAAADDGAAVGGSGAASADGGSGSADASGRNGRHGSSGSSSSGSSGSSSSGSSSKASDLDPSSSSSPPPQGPPAGRPPKPPPPRLTVPPRWRDPPPPLRAPPPRPPRPQSPRAPAPRLRVSRPAAAGDPPSGRGHLHVQRHTVSAEQLALVLGDARLGGTLAVAPPSTLAVARLYGLEQLGLGGRPAMVLGSDVWGRRRAVLCLKAGVLHLSTDT